MTDVFVPTWNNERTVSKCLESIEKAIPNAQVTILDRCSSDATVEIARRHNVVNIIQDRNMNLGKARTFEAKMARGEWYCHVDSDTYLRYNWFSEMLKWRDHISSFDSQLGGLQGENIPMYNPYHDYIIWHRSKRQYPLKNPDRLLGCNLFLLKEALSGMDISKAYAYEDWMQGQYIQKHGFNSYVVPAYCDHDSYRTKNEIMKHARWGMAGARLNGGFPLWKTVVACAYVPLFKVPYPFKQFVFWLHLQWLMGWLLAKSYMDLKRPRGFN